MSNNVIPLIEERSLKNATSQRKREFAAGRTSARTALRKLGAAAAGISIGKSREPLWPEGIVGSISHAGGIAIAAVAPQSRVSAIGIDVEIGMAVKSDVWDQILIQSEIEWIMGHSPEQQLNIATIIFCAKESFYKLQFPSTNAWVNFQEAEVCPILNKGTFLLRCSNSSVTKIFSKSEFAGKFASIHGFTIATMYVEAEFDNN